MERILAFSQKKIALASGKYAKIWPGVGVVQRGEVVKTDWSPHRKCLPPSRPTCFLTDFAGSLAGSLAGSVGWLLLPFRFLLVLTGHNRAEEVASV